MELHGWPSGEDLPDYRILKGAMVGHAAAPGAMIQTTIPTDWLPADILELDPLAMPVRGSVAHVQKSAESETLTHMPSHSSLLAQFVNKANAGSADFHQIHLVCPGSAYEGIITTVRSRLVSLVSDLRRSIPTNARLDDRKVAAAVSRAAPAVAVTIAGNNNAVNVGDTAEPDPSPRRSRGWKRVSAALTSLVVLVGAVIEVMRREDIWPF